MKCLLCWYIMDGSRLPGYSESEINTALFLVCTSPWKVLDTDVGNEVFLKFDLFARIRDICIKNQKYQAAFGVNLS